MTFLIRRMLSSHQKIGNASKFRSYSTHFDVRIQSNVGMVTATIENVDGLMRGLLPGVRALSGFDRMGRDGSLHPVRRPRARGPAGLRLTESRVVVVNRGKLRRLAGDGVSPCRLE